MVGSGGSGGEVRWRPSPAVSTAGRRGDGKEETVWADEKVGGRGYPLCRSPTAGEGQLAVVDPTWEDAIG